MILFVRALVEKVWMVPCKLHLTVDNRSWGESLAYVCVGEVVGALQKTPQRQVVSLLGPGLQQCVVLTTFLLAINQVTGSSRERLCGLLYTLG